MTKGFSSDISKRVLAEIDFSEIEEQENDALELQGEKLWRKINALNQRNDGRRLNKACIKKAFN